MTRNLMRRAVAIVTVFTMVALGAATASALNKDDILRLVEAGLDAGTIVNVIRGTTEELEVTPDDVEELQAAGVDDAILSELRLRLGIGSSDTGTGTPTLQQELEEQQRLEAERRRLEEERLEREREAMRGQIDAEREREGAVQSGFQGLRRARALYQDGDFAAASAVYNRFLEEVNPDPLSDEYYEAKFGLIQAMHAAGYRDVIRADSLEVALLGADRRHFADSVRILRDVVNEAAFASPRIADLSNEVITDMSADFQDEFNYFLGRYYYQSGDLSTALTYLGRVGPEGDYAARSAFLSGVILVSPSMGENIRAVQMLERAILSADFTIPGDQEVSENAYLALARIAYQVGNFGGATYYYSKVSTEGQRWTTAIFESGWTAFLNGDLNRALGAFHSLHSPYHNHRFFPDLFVLEAAAYLYSCNIDEAYDAIGTFETQIGSLRDNLREFVAEASDPTVYYRALFEPDSPDSAGDPRLPEDAYRAILADADFHRLHRVITQLQDELTLLDEMESSLGSRGETSRSLVEGDLSNRQLEVAVLVHDLIQDLLDELDDWWFKSQEVSIEIADLEARYLEAILRSGENAIQEGTTFVIVADDWQYWPWEGEYWLDEVGSYRGNLTTRCPDDVQF